MKKGIAFIVVLGMLLCGCSEGQNNSQTNKTQISVQPQVSEESSEESKEESKLPEPESRDVFAMDTYMVLKAYGNNAKRFSKMLKMKFTDLNRFSVSRYEAVIFQR